MTAQDGPRHAPAAFGGGAIIGMLGGLIGLGELSSGFRF